MRNQFIWKQRVQEEKEHLKDYEIFESADYIELLRSITSEITGGTLKEVQLVKEPDAPYGGKCSSLRILLNIANEVTRSFPTIELKSDSIVGILGHECGHWNYSDFELCKNYLSNMEQGKWSLQLPLPKDWSGQERIMEISEFLTGNHPAARYIMTETASFIQNMLEDVYVEEIMCSRYPGSIQRGILQNRMRNMERMPSLKVQLNKGYRPVSVMLNLMVQYSLTGMVNNWEMETGILLDLLEEAKPIIDYGVTCTEAAGRLMASNRLLLLIWRLLKSEIEDIEEKTKQKKQSYEKRSFKAQEAAETLSEVQKEWENVKRELPDFLCSKDEETVRDTQPSIPKKQQKEFANKPIEISGQVLLCIEKIAESKAEKTHNAEVLNTLRKELFNTEFDGDHRKVKMTVERKSQIGQREMAQYELAEPRVKQIMRKMKSVLLPVFYQQGERTEKHLFFGTKIHTPSLYDPYGRFYQKKESAKELNAAVAILVDLSASMLGERLEQAIRCCLSLYEFCIHVGIPILIYGHHTNGEGYFLQNELVTLHSLAEFEPDRNDRYRIASMDVTGSNRDGAALAYVGEKLAKRTEKTKLLCCITDGRPNGARYCGEEAERDIQNIKKKLEARGVIVMAAAIGGDKDMIERIYREGYLNISDLETLTVVLARELWKRILR